MTLLLLLILGWKVSSFLLLYSTCPFISWSFCSTLSLLFSLFTTFPSFSFLISAMNAL